VLWVVLSSCGLGVSALALRKTSASLRRALAAVLLLASAHLAVCSPVVPTQFLYASQTLQTGHVSVTADDSGNYFYGDGTNVIKVAPDGTQTNIGTDGGGVLGSDKAGNVY